MTPAVLLVLVAFAIYSLLSKAISRSLLTLPIIFTALGFALSVPLSASLSPDVIHEGKKILAEITLILILFSDASHVRFKKLVMDWRWRPPPRLCSVRSLVLPSVGWRPRRWTGRKTAT